MSRARFYAVNYLTQDQTTFDIDAGDENSLFPIENIQDPHTSTVFRSPNGVNTIEFIADVKSLLPVNAFFIKGHPISGLGLNTINIEASPTNNFTSPAFSINVNIKHEYNLGYYLFDEAQSYRFWKFEITSYGPYIELSNLYLGTETLTYENNTLDFGWDKTQEDTSKIKRNRYKQPFIDVINDVEMLGGSITNMHKAEYKSLHDLFNLTGRRNPFWFVLDNEGILIEDGQYILSGQFYFEKRPSMKNNNVRFDTDINMIEAI
jgi:hypothetical protein